MKTKTLHGIHWMVVSSAIGLLCAVANTTSSHADTIFFDDFTDGSPFDGVPVQWLTGTGDDSIRIEGDDLVLGDYNTGGTGNYAYAFVVVNPFPDDMSIRTQIRLRSGESVAFGAHYGMVLNENGLLGIGEKGEDLFASTTTNLRVEQEDVILQVDLIGNQISAWAWRPHETMPIVPLLTSTKNMTETGNIEFSIYSPASPTEQLEAVFRYVHVADTHIPEPSTIVLSCFGVVVVLAGYRRRGEPFRF